MQQRHRRAVRVTLTSIGAMVPIAGLERAFLYLPSPVELIWQVALTTAVGALWIHWQRREWERALPRRTNAWCAIVLSAVICLAVASTHGTALEPAAVTTWRRAGGELSAQWATLLGTILTAPLLEEAVFRGYMLGRLRRSFGSTTSVLFSSAVFAVAHADPERIPIQLVVGVVLGMVVVRTGRLWLAMATHGLATAMATLQLFTGTTNGPGQPDLSLSLLCLVVALGTALALHRVLSATRWNIPIPPSARVAVPRTWGLDAAH